MDPAKVAAMRQDLKAQKKAKRQQQRAEAMRDREEAETLKAQVAIMGARQEQQYIESRRQAMELQAQWKLQQKTRDQSPEWDLNGPGPGVAGRVGDDDPRCGPSSMQKFGGEDINHKARVAQAERERQQQLDYQMALRAQKNTQEAERDRRDAEQMAAVTNYAQRLAAQEYMDKRAEAYRLQQENKAMARMKREQAQRQKASEDELSKLEMHVTMSQLNEEQRSNLARNGRVQRDAFKGMTPQQRAAFLDENARLAAEKQAQLAREKEEEQMHAAMAAQAAAAAQDEAAHRYLNSKRDELRLQQEIRLQAKEKKRAEAARNHAAKNNSVEDVFFDRFGK